ncbi:MAG TPA: nitroreductase family protein [Chloroflexota bacterium]
MPERLNMPLGEAMFSQRAIRRVKPDPIPETDLRLLLEAAGQAPSSTNAQPWHFVVVTDAGRKTRLRELYHESWWTWFRATGQDKLPEAELAPHTRAAMRLSAELDQAPVLIIACTLKPNIPNEALAAIQNLLLAARARGIGATLTRLHATVEQVKAEFGIPADAEVFYCIRLGCPLQAFGPLRRKPVADICSLNRFGEPVPWLA